jgi:hypothetical protein
LLTIHVQELFIVMQMNSNLHLKSRFVFLCAN